MTQWTYKLLTARANTHYKTLSGREMQQQIIIIIIYLYCFVCVWTNGPGRRHDTAKLNEEHSEPDRSAEHEDGPDTFSDTDKRRR